GPSRFLGCATDARARGTWVVLNSERAGNRHGWWIHHQLRPVAFRADGGNDQPEASRRREVAEESDEAPQPGATRYDNRVATRRSGHPPHAFARLEVKRRDP